MSIFNRSSQNKMRPGEANEILRKIPYLSKEELPGMAERAFEAFKITTAHYDTPFYVNPVRVMAPYFTGDQILFLWKRGLEMLASGDNEMRWFGQIKLANLAPFLPEPQKLLHLLKIDLDSLNHDESHAILLFQRSTFAVGKEKIRMQQEVWELMKQYCNVATTNNESIRAFVGKWKAASDKEGDMTVLEAAVSEFEPETVWAIWEQLMRRFQAGNHFPPRELLCWLTTLAKHMPRSKKLAALQSINILEQPWLNYNTNEIRAILSSG